MGQTESWQAGSTYRIQPIQERAKRPLWTINNGASGFVSCLWEHRKRMGEHVMKSGRGGGGEGPPLRFLISLCAHSFLLSESIAGESQAISSTKQHSLNWGSVCASLSINVLANKCC